MVVVSSYPASNLLLNRHRNLSFKSRVSLLLRLTGYACNVVHSEPRFPGRTALCVLLVISAADASLHIAMEKYAMFAVTCSEKFLDMYIDIIEAENDIWVAVHTQGNAYIRQLKVSWSLNRSAFSLILVRQCRSTTSLFG